MEITTGIPPEKRWWFNVQCPWTVTGIKKGTGFPIRPLRKPPGGARDVITLPDGREAQWWSEDYFALSDGTFMHKREMF